MKNEIVQVKIRMSRALRDAIEAASEASDRTMNTEILYRLANTFKPKLPDEVASEAYNQAARLHGEVLRMISDFRDTLKALEMRTAPAKLRGGKAKQDRSRT